METVVRTQLSLLRGTFPQLLAETIDQIRLVGMCKYSWIRMEMLDVHSSDKNQIIISLPEKETILKVLRRLNISTGTKHLEMLLDV